jgi:hypothetical protein
MLAFTVQFSRYGRNQEYSAPHPRRPFVPAVSSQRPKRSGCFLRTQQRAHSPGRSLRSFGGAAGAGCLLTARSRAGQVNSQCSTRKHGRPRRHSLRKSAGAP